MAIQLVISGNRILAHGEDCFLAMGGTVVCHSTGKAYQNATVVIHDGGLPADIDKVGYEYHAGRFVPCAPYGFGDGDILVACEGDCGAPKRDRAKASEVIDQVGDIKTTARHSAGAEWLLCDGSVVDAEKYPELAKLCCPDITKATLAGERIFQGSSSSNNKVYCILCHEGYWIVGGTRYDGTNTYACIAYSESLSGPWTTVDLWSYAAKTDYSKVGGIAYHNGYFVVAGTGCDSSSYYARIAYATALGGEWTIKDIWNESGSTTNISHIDSSGEHIVVGGEYGNYARVAYATSPDGEWTKKNLAGTSETSATFCCLRHANGYWVAGVTTYQSAGYGSAYVYYATNPGESWGSQRLWGDSNYNHQYLYDVTFAAGYWVIVGRHEASASDVESDKIAFATSPDGTWAAQKVSATPYCIGYCQGYWIIGGQSAVRYATDLSGEWTSVEIAGTSPSTLQCICCAGFDLAFGGGSSYAVLVRNTGKPVLPIMPSAYIKAK